MLLSEATEDSVIVRLYQVRFKSAKALTKKESWKALVDLFLQSHLSTYAPLVEVGSGHCTGKQGFMVRVEKS